jgi:hypothetical protein
MKRGLHFRFVYDRYESSTNLLEIEIVPVPVRIHPSSPTGLDFLPHVTDDAYTTHHITQQELMV